MGAQAWGQNEENGEGPGLGGSEGTGRAGLPRQAPGSSSRTLTPPPRSSGASSPGAKKAGTCSANPQTAGTPGPRGSGPPPPACSPSPGPGWAMARGAGAGDWGRPARPPREGAGLPVREPGRCPWCRRTAGSLTACSRRRRCRRSPGRGHTRAPRGRRSRPCPRRRPERPTWGGRGELFAGAEAGAEEASAGRAPQRPQSARAEAACGFINQGRAVRLLKAPAPAERRACPRRGRGLPQDLAPPASRGDPRPLPPTGWGASSPREELDAPPGPGVGGGLWTEGGTTFWEKQSAFPHPPDHKVSMEGLLGAPLIPDTATDAPPRRGRKTGD